MSTRTNILILNGETKLWLYRHHDGYLAATGADLAVELAKAPKDASVFVKALLAKEYEATSYCGPRPIYEVTTEQHGDIDYLYVVRFDESRLIATEIGVSGRGYEDRPQLSNAARGTLAEFVEQVNGAIKVANLRLRELQAKNPGPFYGDMQPQELLDLLPAKAVL